MKYSVIVPVYNAEATIDRCVQSLLNQQYSSAEIILVDDGSEDCSRELCQAYAQQYAQVKLISKENGGVSSARNAGLDVAIGEYILFVDSDDFVTDHYFSTLDKATPDTDLLLFSYTCTDGEKQSKIILSEYQSRNNDEYFSKLADLIGYKYINSPCNKRYSRRRIQDLQLRFAEQLSIGEDTLFNLSYALSCNSCQILEHPVYCVSIENPQSLSRKIRTDLKEQFAISDCAMMNAIEKAGISEHNRQKLFHAMNLLALRDIYSDAKRMHRSEEKLMYRMKRINEKCKEFNHRKLDLPKDPFATILLVPVRLHLVPIIDLMGWKLAQS